MHHCNLHHTHYTHVPGSSSLVSKARLPCVGRWGGGAAVTALGARPHLPGEASSFGPDAHRHAYGGQLLPRAAATSLSRPDDAVAEESSSGFFAEADSFTALGLSPAVQAGLAASGFTRPSVVQELVAPHLLRGRNTVITAETGSGKTLSYVAPMVSLMAKHRAAIMQQELEQQSSPEQPDRARARRFHALVLCPNVALCQQVASVVTSLRGEDGKPLATAALVNSSNPPPFDAPDFIVATPAGLLTILNDANGAYGWLWTEEGMQARVRHVVLDEADLLLGEAFRKATDRLLTAFKVNDRRRVEAKVFEELGIDKEHFARLPRDMQQAAWRGGVPALLAEGYEPAQPLDPNAKHGPYWRRQYVYAAATMPAATFSDVGSQIQKRHPDAQWVTTELLHQSKPQVQHAWQEVADANFAAVLVDAIKRDPAHMSQRGKTLVFAADGAAADAASTVLSAAGVAHVLYHKSRTMAEQAAALKTLKSQPGTVMVCTDAASRGLDIQGVSHIVQADFAPNAIDFIHRIGRTARAGQAGRVTSLFRDKDRPLVEVLRGYIADGMPLEAAFSRARSFRKKMRRSGGVFVPRGQAAAGGGAE